MGFNTTVKEHAPVTNKTKGEIDMTNQTKTFVAVKVEGHHGTFTEINSIRLHGRNYFLLESDNYGEDADHIAIYEDGKLLVDGLTEGTQELIKIIQRNIGSVAEGETLKSTN